MKREKWGKLLRVIFGRTSIFALTLIVQIAVLFAAFRWIRTYLLYGGFTLLSAVVVLYIINKRQNPSYQLAWVIPVLVIPVFGSLFYLFVEIQRGPRRLRRRLQNQLEATQAYLVQDPAVSGRLTKESRRAGHLAGYVSKYGGYPVYDKTHVRYFELGDTMYPVMLEELRQARCYIFPEYFIIERGEMWNTILDILTEKVQEG
ncbi:MAG: PLDc N-terminal domain-containing protein, partial [Lachnospiraceae bacterium]